MQRNELSKPTRNAEQDTSYEGLTALFDEMSLEAKQEAHNTTQETTAQDDNTYFAGLTSQLEGLQELLESAHAKEQALQAKISALTNLLEKSKTDILSKDHALSSKEYALSSEKLRADNLSLSLTKSENQSLVLLKQHASLIDIIQTYESSDKAKQDQIAALQSELKAKQSAPQEELDKIYETIHKQFSDSDRRHKVAIKKQHDLLIEARAKLSQAQQENAQLKKILHVKSNEHAYSLPVTARPHSSFFKEHETNSQSEHHISYKPKLR